MSNQSDIKNERLERLNENFLYELSYQHFNNIDDETDMLIEKYKNINEPHNLNEWFIKFNKEFEKDNRRKKRRKKRMKLGRQVASIILVFVIIGTTVTMSVEAYRIRFFNIVIETTQHFSLITNIEENNSGENNSIPEEWKDYYYPTYIPEEFKLIKYIDYGESKHLEYSDTTNSNFKLVQSSLITKSQIDTENGKIFEVDINGNYGFLVVEDTNIILTWSNNSRNFTLLGNIDKSEILKVAESLEYNE